MLNVVAAKNDKDIYLVFEYMDTDLHAVIRKGGILQVSVKILVFDIEPKIRVHYFFILVVIITS